MPRPVKLPAPTFDLTHHTLDNGLRVVVAPDRSAPVVGVAVLYDVGIRSEPEGRTGFAHLFEHLMFQGSANLEKLEHFRYVQSSGGTFNGSTHFDYTNYFEALPSNALERGLFLEADRMLSPRITEENLANQLEVVKNEIRVNVLNRPYGGFPWIMLPGVLFDTFANSHNGYGGFEDLEGATVDDARDFFAKYYAPANAVLAVAGDLDVDETLAWSRSTSARSRSAARRSGRASANRRCLPSAGRRTTTRTRRCPRWRSATACPTRSGASTSISPTCCSPRCSPMATRRGCSSGWCSAINSSPTSPPTSASSAIRSTSATPRR